MKNKLLVLLLLASLLSACSPKLPSQPNSDDSINPTNSTNKFADFPDLGIAPELSNDIWINTSTPLRIADLRGKVVLLDMWTFG
jgi:hypothetical protein